MLQECQDEARRIVAERWESVEAVATRLENKSSLDGPDVKSIVEAG